MKKRINGNDMKTIIQKGIAGLGNRMQVLGWCVDLAEKHEARVLVDWRDSSWRTGFSRYFKFKDPIAGNYKPGDENGVVLPKWWDGKAHEKCAKQLAHDKFARVRKDHLEQKWDTLVACQYRAKHSGRIFEIVEFSEHVWNRFLKWRCVDPGDYDCWHIRDLDKSGGEYSKILNQIKAAKTPRKKVVITDNLKCKRRAKMMGIECPSIIPPPPEKGGVHHVNDPRLKEAGLTKHDVNTGACVDALVGVCSAEFHATCEGSTFSEMINQMRGKNDAD